MEPLRYRASLRGIGPILLYALATFVVVDGGCVAAWIKYGHIPAELLALGVVWPVVGLVLFARAGAETVADERGISVRRRVGGGTLHRWDEIRRIRTDFETGRVEITTKQSGTVLLPAPAGPRRGPGGAIEPDAELRRYARAQGWTG